MMAGAWLLVLGIATVYFGNVLERQQNPNQRVEGSVRGDGVREVVLERNRGGHYVASGAINDVPVVFLLDTGASTVSVPESLARVLGLAQGAAEPVLTAAGVITTYSTRLERVRLGTIEIEDVRGHINPLMEGREVLLGMSFLKRLEFTQRGNQLTLRQHPASS